MEKRTIGKIQIGFGIFILILAIVGFFFSYDTLINRTMETLDKFADAVSEWRESQPTDNSSKQEIDVHHSSGAMVFLAPMLTTFYILIFLAVITALMGIIMILQGLANISDE